MRRQLFNLAAVVSLLLFAATCAICVRTQFASDMLLTSVGDHSAGLRGMTSGLSAFWVTPRASKPPGFSSMQAFGSWSMNWRTFIVPAAHDRKDASTHPTHYSWLGFVFSPAYRVPPSPLWNTEIFMPFYALLACTAVLPIARLRRWLRERPPRPTNRCVQCGYDLRATPDRCPECGTIPSTISQNQMQ